MSFKVGQRVRIVKSTRGFEGRAATIVSVVHECRDHKSGENYIGHWIDIDGIGERSPENGRRWGSPPHWLEPLDDSRELGSWSVLEGIWRPALVGGGV